MNLVRQSVVLAVFFSSVFALSSCSGARQEVSNSQQTEAVKVESEETLLKNLADKEAALPKNSPELEEPLEKLASYYELKNRYDLAEKYLQQLPLCKESNWNWERLSKSLQEQKKFDEAIDAMKKSVALVEAKNKNDNTAAVYIRYAKLLELAGRADEAKPLREKAHELAPNVKNSTIRWHKSISQ
ncbi:MAG: hypothetical protein DKT66_06400 [Candidatus Melainabacteria bacterium]|nr:MAG: hypothetical protein DKT66_06400 [Candidatus Melainabacteria bacterium]